MYLIYSFFLFFMFLCAFDNLLQYVHHLQRKYSIGSFNLLGRTAPVQAASLLIVGPFFDYWLTGQRVDAYSYSSISVVSTHSKFDKRVIPAHFSCYKCV